MGEDEELIVEIACLKAENITLRGRIASDRRFADEKLRLEMRLTTQTDKHRLQEQIEELQRTLEAEYAVIDRLVVYLRKKNHTEESS